MLDAPKFFSNTCGESYSQSFCFFNSMPRDQMSDKYPDFFVFLKNLEIPWRTLQQGNSFPTALCSGSLKRPCIFRKTSNGYLIDLSSKRQTSAGPFGRKRYAPLLSPEDFVPYVTKSMATCVTAPSVLCLMLWNTIAWHSIKTNVTILMLVKITRGGVKITFKRPRKLSNSTLRLSFSKIMLSPPGCLTSCLNSCLDIRIVKQFSNCSQIFWVISSCLKENTHVIFTVTYCDEFSRDK